MSDVGSRQTACRCHCERGDYGIGMDSSNSCFYATKPGKPHVTPENQDSLDAQGIHVDEFVRPLSPHVVSGWMQTWELGRRHGVAPTNPPGNFLIRARTPVISSDEDSLISLKVFAKDSWLIRCCLLKDAMKDSTVLCSLLSFPIFFPVWPASRNAVGYVLSPLQYFFAVNS
jgi:hypothetical protein